MGVRRTASADAVRPGGWSAPGEAVRLENVRKVYGRDGDGVVALAGVSVGFARSTFTAVMGPSGSGKSTFLNCAAGLDRPTGGSVVVDGVELGGLGETALTRLRRERIGYVFQAYNLLPTLTAAQNVSLPLRFAGQRAKRSAVLEVLDRVGMADRHAARPDELSGGQNQRVAIARALITRPAVLFADEPTGALDTRTAREVLGLLREAVETTGQTVVVVTHDPAAASRADRVVFLADGRFVGDLYRPTPEVVADRMTHLGAWADADVAESARARS